MFMQLGIKERRKPWKEFTEEIMRQAGKQYKKGWNKRTTALLTEE